MKKEQRMLHDFNKVNQLKAEIEKKRIPMEDRVAYIGLVFVQLALLPSFFSTDLPHYSLPLMVFMGLICYQYRAWVQKDMVYTIGNTIGLILNASMLIRIWV
tara:strand:- start:67 stop:372 length:306 start_codon:yes stop_codon:yes gene_type:complete